MPSFTFTAKQKDGKKILGVIKALDRLDAIRQMERAGCIPLTIEQQRPAACGNHESPAATLVSKRKNKRAVIALSFVVLGLLGWLTVSLFAPKATPVVTRPARISTGDGLKSHVEPLVCPDPPELQEETTEAPLEVTPSREEQHVPPAVQEVVIVPVSAPTQEVVIASVPVASPEVSEDTPPLKEEDTQDILRWSVGVVNADFGITRAEFRGAIRASVRCWENALGETLFEYDPINGMPVNLLVNDVTKKLKKEDKLTAKRDELNAHWEELNAKWEELNAQWKQLDLQCQFYDEQKGLHDAAHKKLDAPGGNRDAESYARLHAECRQMNKWTKEINVIIEQQNNIGNSMRVYNDQINKHRDAIIALNPEERDSMPVGVFHGGDHESIDIYHYSSGNALMRIVIHEFGHALGFPGHVSDPSSIMYHAGATDKEPILTGQDVDAVQSHLKYGNGN